MAAADAAPKIGGLLTTRPKRGAAWPVPAGSRCTATALALVLTASVSGGPARDGRKGRAPRGSDRSPRLPPHTLGMRTSSAPPGLRPLLVRSGRPRRRRSRNSFYGRMTKRGGDHRTEARPESRLPRSQIGVRLRGGLAERLARTDVSAHLSRSPDPVASGLGAACAAEPLGGKPGTSTAARGRPSTGGSWAGISSPRPALRLYRRPHPSFGPLGRACARARQSISRSFS